MPANQIQYSEKYYDDVRAWDPLDAPAMRSMRARIVMWETAHWPTLLTDRLLVVCARSSTSTGAEDVSVSSRVFALRCQLGLLMPTRLRWH